eukprot:TRINITY_DN16886_c0_g1_i1.p1 TRINITY_DN16886_c0_g1~~TRINITY_DN16886_c0_g1_i1.p1  ORF type:complete len:496 (-),score=166.70 TRINITY_DN16886_c0_g1_i1:218-1705(-)
MCIRDRSSAMPKESVSHEALLSSEDHNALKVEPAPPTPTESLGFPPMLELPGIREIVAFVIVAAFFALSLTVFKDDWEDAGVTSSDIIKFGSIPLISIGFTYCHIWLALWLTFYPLEFFGILQIPGTNVGLCGWQGIVPFRAESMARHALELMTTQLLSPEEVFARLEPDKVAEQLDATLQQRLPEIVDTASAKHMPAVWNMIPQATKQELIDQAREEAPAGVMNIMTDMNADINRVFDIEKLVVRLFTENKQLLCDMFIECGDQELRFLRNSGAFWGGVFGLIQMVLWMFPATKQPAIVFPAFGFIVGALTNWIALKLIFSPIDPIYPCGPDGFYLQGLFLRRQTDVAAVFGRIIASRVLTARNIIDAIVTGPTAAQVAAIVTEHVHDAVDKIPGPALPLVKFSMGDPQYQELKNDIAAMLCEEMPKMMGCLEEYAQDAFDLETTLRVKMAALPPSKFERLLHPVFEPDEWKLILMGGMLGVAIGLVQAYGINA